MWHVLRAELAYFRSYLLTAWAIAAAVAVMINVLTLLGGDDEPRMMVAAGVPGIFLVVAAMIVAFVAQGTRSEERRARLLLTGPLTPRQLGGAMVLLPACLVGLGAVAALLVVGVASLLTGELEVKILVVVSAVAGQLFGIVQMGPLAQEATAARRQRRRRATVTGWLAFGVAVLLLVAAQGIDSRLGASLVQLLVAPAAMLMSVALYAGRTDFTR